MRLPVISGAKAVRAFERSGWRVDRQRGSHVVMLKAGHMIRVRAAEALDGFRLRLRLTDGSERIVDTSQYLHGPIFEPLRANPALFAAVSVDPVFGTVVWPNGADIDPDVLINDRTPAAALAHTRS